MIEKDAGLVIESNIDLLTAIQFVFIEEQDIRQHFNFFKEFISFLKRSLLLDARRTTLVKVFLNIFKLY